MGRSRVARLTRTCPDITRTSHQMSGDTLPGQTRTPPYKGVQMSGVRSFKRWGERPRSPVVRVDSQHHGSRSTHQRRSNRPRPACVCDNRSRSQAERWQSAANASRRGSAITVIAHTMHTRRDNRVNKPCNYGLSDIRPRHCGSRVTVRAGEKPGATEALAKTPDLWESRPNKGGMVGGYPQSSAAHRYSTSRSNFAAGLKNTVALWSRPILGAVPSKNSGGLSQIPRPAPECPAAAPRQTHPCIFPACGYPSASERKRLSATLPRASEGLRP
jgi:hypothetical protein